ncbi:MAG: tetratricopeptide repeat protein [Planctomycetes bacterium]|nr:tetratricopeptide repeat protein [Planctomycetota bacterium]
MSRPAEALRAYRQALQEDVCPLRALPSMHKIVLDVASQWEVPVVDFAEIVAGQDATAIPGNGQFLDHVHPTIDCHLQLALGIVQAMVDQGIIAPSDEWRDTSTRQMAVARIKSQVESRIDQQAHGRAMRNVAQVMAWAGKFEEARRAAGRAVALAPNDGEAHYLLGRTSQIGGEYHAAVVHYRRALTMVESRADPPYYLAEVYNNLGAILLRNDKLEEAEAHFRKALGLRPIFAEATLNLGVILLKRKQFDAATAQFEAALRIEPEIAEAHFHLGRVALRRNQLELAQRHLNEALRIRANYAKAHEELAEVYLRQDQYRQAAEHYRRALASQPGNVPTANNLAWLLATCRDDAVRDGQQALTLARQCCESTGHKIPAFLDTLAAAHAEVGQFDQAVEIAATAIRLATQNDQPKIADSLRQRLEQYQSHRPIRE